MNWKHAVALFLIAPGFMLMGMSCSSSMAPVDEVNPYMGNISHLLKPTYPMVHLPNSMLRVCPRRDEYTQSTVHGLPLFQMNHRGSFAFDLSPYQGEPNALRRVFDYPYDNEHIAPYEYQVDLNEGAVHVNFVPSHQSALYTLSFQQNGTPYLILNGGNGELEAEGTVVKGYQNMWNGVRIFLYMETDQMPSERGVFRHNQWNTQTAKATGDDCCIVLAWPAAPMTLSVRYGISYISVEQAKANFLREVAGKTQKELAAEGRKIWNHELGKIKVEGGTAEDRTVFYTSLYRCLERPVCISEDGNYFNVYEQKVCSDEGHAFYTDDWLWDTYRAAHPLRILLDEHKETDIIRSFIRAAASDPHHDFPNFPQITGDSRSMNCNHGVAVLADAYCKGLQDFNMEEGYRYCRNSIEKKTLAPWSSARAGWLDDFYRRKGYVPALWPGEQETVPEVDGFEKRQAVAVTLGTAYDQWCLSRLAAALGNTDEEKQYAQCGTNYRNLYNPATGFFHPKDSAGQFIEPFDYRFAGGIGARHYYDENNGWVYRWDVPHGIEDLMDLMGGNEVFVHNLDVTFSEWLGRSKYEFYAQLPDHTGNVGQYSMGNEPSLHIPYLYNYAGAAWKTQQRIRSLVHQWFRNDLMGLPGDEDGGGLSSFVVFSMMGFYPVTPGLPSYQIGSPFFSKVKIKLSNGKTFEIEAKDCSVDAKYIQSATLNGKSWNRTDLSHHSLIEGKLVLDMGVHPNKQWGVQNSTSMDIE